MKKMKKVKIKCSGTSELKEGLWKVNFFRVHNGCTQNRRSDG